MKLRLLTLGLMMSLVAGADQAGTDQNKTNSNKAPAVESVSETIAKANKAIASRLLEGDIVVDRNRNAVSCWMCKWPKDGSYVKIPIRFDPSYSSSEKNLIFEAMKTIEDRTCVKFEEISFSWSLIRRHLYFYPGSGCFAYIGRQWWIKQTVSLSKDCLTRATIQHEILHALGFAHEQSRSDRDDYVTVLYDNIKPDEKHNFNKYETNNLQTPYDFSSVMQYSNYLFSKNGKPTLVSKANPGLSFGYASGVNDNDILRVNRWYECQV